MAKSRQKIQQQGFWDEEVLQPDHDAICLWALRNAEQLLRMTKPELYGGTWCDAELDELRRDLKEDAKHTYQYDLDGTVSMLEEFARTTPKPFPAIETPRLEYVLRNDRGIVGYGDLFVKFSLPTIHPIRAERKSYNDQPSGFQVLSTRYGALLVEAKSRITTIGELMRQINLYRTAFDDREFPNRTIVVLSPDDRFANDLLGQGVKFVRFEPSWLYAA